MVLGAGWICLFKASLFCHPAPYTFLGYPTTFIPFTQISVTGEVTSGLATRKMRVDCPASSLRRTEALCECLVDLLPLAVSLDTNTSLVMYLSLEVRFVMARCHLVPELVLISTTSPCLVVARSKSLLRLGTYNPPIDFLACTQVSTHRGYSLSVTKKLKYTIMIIDKKVNIIYN